ncbi:VOC family protein [Thalassococcus sp. S3]|uniref:VOC family protein n=1 Tax=Thalassococcus sp. S3 TaxID=2017482 RepID=UPI001024186E|nr:VOC family protein [Thalassococcus sp. S3]QBF32848.1 polyphosphate kinase [Thalassococcus sp. S3]
MLELDHLAVSGETLEDAKQAMEAALGVSLQAGGRHDVFGTHNALLGLDDGLYLEAIAIDPKAPVPDRPRWFDLDQFRGAPRLTNWICRTERLEEVLARLPEGAGGPVDLRRGDLRWTMVVPKDGRLPFDNLHPALIRWTGGGHPSDMLAASGCRLKRLVVMHPMAKTLAEVLAPLLNDTRVAFETEERIALCAEIDTPHGVRSLK